MTSGDQIGKYRLERELGAGGMGTVWLAHDTELDRKVALKVLRPALAGDDTAQARLLREARAMAKLRHPNVITVFDAETVAGRDLVAMELIDGTNMATWLSVERTEDEILGTLLSAGRGLAAAHVAGMVHRDFKPHNVLVEIGGRVLVTDFGLARADAGSDALAATVESGPKLVRNVALEETVESNPDPAKPIDMTATSAPSKPTSNSGRGALDSPLTMTGTLLGTPAYMAPEQIAGRGVDARSDQFAFCVTAWEALTGKRPFPGTDVADIAKAIERGDPAYADKVPRRLRPILLRGLAADPRRRWPAMDPLLRELDRAVWRPKKIKAWSQAIGLGVFGFIAIFVVSAFMSHKSTPTCSGAKALASVYSKDKIASALTDPKALAQLDRWAREWSTAYDGNCKKPSDDDFTARQLCLEGQRDQMSLLVDPKVVKSLVGADLAVMLPDPAGCVNAPRVIAPPLPKDPALRERVQELRTLMIVLRGHLLANEPVDDAAIARANAVVAAVHDSDSASVRADAMAVKSLIVATSARTSQDPKAMVDVYDLMKQASDLAEAAGQDRTRVQLQLGMLEMAVFLPGLWSKLDDLIQRGEAGVEHVKDPVAQLVLDEAKAEVANVRGRWTAAIDGYERVRQGWLARGSAEVYARYTIAMATALLSRHAPGDVDRALASLRESLTHDLRPGTQERVRFMMDAISEAIGKADPATFGKLGYTRDAGAPDGGTLIATVSGLEQPTLADVDTQRAARHGVPEVRVMSMKQNWRIAIGSDGVFTLANLPPGTYSVEAFVNSAAGDLQMVRRDATITAHGTTKLELPYPAITQVETPIPSTTTPKAMLGIAIALPGKPPATVGELTKMLATTPWWSVVTVHSVRRNDSVVLEAVTGLLGEGTVCPIERAYNNGSDPMLFMPSDATPVSCH
jgi:serine/threonine protein kinase